MARKRSLAQCTLLLVVLPALTLAQEGDTRVVAEIAGRRILAADVLQTLRAERQRAAADSRLGAFGTGAASAALDQLIEVKLFAAAARAQGLADRPDVTHAIENAIDAVLAQTLVAERTATVAVDDAALRRYYDSHLPEFEAPGRVRARHLVVSSEAEAVALLGKVRRNGDFAQLARANNVDATRDSGGDLGWVAPGVMVGAFDRVLFSLKVGEVGPIVRTPYGFHVVRVEGIEAPARRPFTAVSGEVRQKVLQADAQSWKAELAKKHAVTINAQVLKGLR